MNDQEYQKEVAEAQKIANILEKLRTVGTVFSGSNGMTMTVSAYNNTTKEITLKSAAGKELVAPSDQFVGRVLTGNIKLS